MMAVSDTDAIDEELLSIFAPFFTQQIFNQGDLIYATQSEPLGLYIVESGQLGLSIFNGSSRNQDIIVETLLPGTMVGELELFARRPRLCSLVCLSEGSVWFLSRNSYEDLCIQHPLLMLKFVTLVACPFECTRLYNSLNHFSILRSSH
jgi:SulP family sulfate permease